MDKISPFCLLLYKQHMLITIKQNYHILIPFGVGEFRNFTISRDVSGISFK